MASHPPPATNSKRKRPGSDINSTNPNRNAKRVKITSARTILAQSSEKALNKHGELDVASFVKAREYEIQALEASMASSKTALTTRAFQQVPRALRRRTASHNVKKVPKRLRVRAAKEMKDDKTPTVTARSRNSTSKKRLRVKETKRLQGIAAKVRAKRAAARLEKDNREEEENSEAPALQPPRLKTGVLEKSPKPVSKFRKRQIHKAWLPTHLYHAKRAHMTPPKEPLWRFAIPLTPTEKSYRATHRAGGLRGCIAWDMSYMSIIGVEGVEASLLGVLRCLGIPEYALTTGKGRKWRQGTRSWKGWLRERDDIHAWIASANVIWCAQGESHEMRKQDNITNSTGTRKEKRKLLIQVHPSAFLHLWNEILKVAKMQRPPASVEDLRFEIGAIEITGPGSTEALVGALHPVEPADSGSSTLNSPSEIWPTLAPVTNPASLPANSILGFEVSDPRLHQPSRKVSILHSPSDTTALLEILSAWPPDTTQPPPTLFTRLARFTASRLLPSQKAINRRKAAAPPGAHPSPVPSDPHIPILLLASRAESHGGQGSWTVLLPRKCVVPVWYSLMHHPLSTGGVPRFGGLREKRQIAFEQAVPWFPGDFPGTKAGWEWELQEREKRKAEWLKRPKGKRIEWESVDLGAGRKGELGMGWACDWERLLSGAPVPAPSSTPPDKEPADGPSAPQKPPAKDNPPLGMHHLPSDLILLYLSPSAPTPSRPALATISISLIHRGVPTTCARIYRLPSTDPSLRAQWLLLTKAPQPTKPLKPHPQHQKPSPSAPPHEKRAALASSLLAPTLPPVPPAAHSTPRPEANDPAYPTVPDEEDLVGFVTTGNFNLGEGRGTGIGCVVAARMARAEGRAWRKGLCVVREAGSGLGRVARWEFV
ncbi:hypothetical protein MMC13_008010 [Lambiella insularis]|nr:hypothetical protein [Lambiella insularis]